MFAMAVQQRARNGHVHYMSQDWPDNYKMSSEAFEQYAATIEQDDFEDDVRNLSSSLHQLVGARRDTIKKLRASAEYLDSIWVRCKITRTVGTGANVVGGSLTIAGGILTLTTGGLAAPLIIAGIATSSVGAATNIGSSVLEKIIASKQIRDMSDAMTRDRELTLKISGQIELMRRYKESHNLEKLLTLVEDMLGPHHLLVVILNGLFDCGGDGDNPSALAALEVSSSFLSEEVSATLQQSASSTEATTTPEASKSVEKEVEELIPKIKLEEAGELETDKNEVTSQDKVRETEDVEGKCGNHNTGSKIAESRMEANKEIAVDEETAAVAMGAATAAAAGVAAAASTNGNGGASAAKSALKYNPIGPEVFLETGKVVGQNSTRMAGQVIVGVSAAFLVWDVVDLGWTISDLIRKKGSNAGKTLKDKADELDDALSATMEKYSVEMMRD